MNTHLSYPIQGITHLIIDEMARDAHLRGAAEETESIQVTFQPTEPGGAPEFVAEGNAGRLRNAALIRVTVPAWLAVTVKNATGDVRVENLASDINLEAVHGDLRLTSLTGSVLVAQVDGSLRGEGLTDLRLMGGCNGDLRFEEGHSLTAELIAGDLRLHGATEARINRVRGDVWIEQVEGPVQVTRADGDARLSAIAGPVKIQALSGDLRGAALTGGLAAPHVNGDAVLHGPFGAGEEYVLSAEGDVSVHLPEDADLRLAVKAGGRIRSDAQLTPATDGLPAFTATLGSGAGRMSLSSGGDLRIDQIGVEPRAKAAPDPLSNLGERIRRQVSASLATAGIDIETGEIRWSRGGRVQAGKATRPPSTERTRQSAQPPSSDEQLAILKMVEDRKITPEEAEMLLKALGA